MHVLQIWSEITYTFSMGKRLCMAYAPGRDYFSSQTLPFSSCSFCKHTC
jgi:hypothetical protein